MINDYELVYLAQDMDEEYRKILFLKYYDVINYKVNRVYYLICNKGVSIDDVMQEAYLAFIEAIKSYNQDNDAVFATFLNVCIDRKLNSLITKCNRKKCVILNDAISYDKDDSLLLNSISSSLDPLVMLVNEEEYFYRYNSIFDMLSFFEGFVFELIVNYFSINEISDILSCEKREVYNSIRRIRNKISKNYHLKSL